MKPKVWNYIPWTRPHPTLKDERVLAWVTIDCRPMKGVKLNDDELPGLIKIKVTDRYTEDEYKELAKVISDRLTAWEVEKAMDG